MAELVGRYAPADPGRGRGVMELEACGAGRPCVSAGGSGDHAEQQQPANERLGFCIAGLKQLSAGRGDTTEAVALR